MRERKHAITTFLYTGDRMLYRFVLVSCLLLMFGAASPAAEIPTLQEWYHINSTMEFSVRGPMSYIPNFDTANGGYHTTVMGVTRPNSYGVEIWYHRYKEDTEPQTGWAGGNANVTQVDLNGDGALDYIYDFGRVIRGIRNGTPPEDSVIAQYDWIIGNVYPFTVADLNGDGISDIVANINNVGGGQLFSVLVGGPDLKNLKHTLVPRQKEGLLDAERFIGLLQSQQEQSSFRIITKSFSADQMVWCALVLKEMTTHMVEDSLVLSFQTLDSLPFPTQQTNQWILESATKLYCSKTDGKEYLLASVYDTKAAIRYTIVYDILGDRFQEVMRFRTDNRSMHTLKADINGDGYYDWATRSGDMLYFYAGQREGIDSIPLGRYQLPCSDHVEYIAIIGDVNNDGIRDIAVALQPTSGVDGCFAIILGAPLRTVDVPEPVTGYPHRTFDMQQNNPNPVGAGRTASLPVTTEKLQQLTLDLYTLQGRFIGTLYRGVLPEGTHTLALDLATFQLPRGMHLLRLSGEDGTRDRAILLD